MGSIRIASLKDSALFSAAAEMVKRNAVASNLDTSDETKTESELLFLLFLLKYNL